ncbi:MAG: clan AA aspartic protease [Verrucomicrobiota bacterium]
MGLIRTQISLQKPARPEMSAIEVLALVDTGAVTMCLPQHIALQLQVNEIESREVTLANGSTGLVPYVGPIQISFQKRNSFGGALVMGDEVILGAIPMEDMDLVINPTRQIVTVNPESPNFPMAIVK